MRHECLDRVLAEFIRVEVAVATPLVKKFCEFKFTRGKSHYMLKFHPLTVFDLESSQVNNKEFRFTREVSIFDCFSLLIAFLTVPFIGAL